MRETTRFFWFFQINVSVAEHLGIMVELWFVFSLIWSICASVDEDGRKKIDNFLREMDCNFPGKVLCRARLFFFPLFDT